MNEETSRPPSASEPPEAAVKRRSGISIVWVIPLVAAAIGGFLAYKAYTEQGSDDHASASTRPRGSRPARPSCATSTSRSAPCRTSPSPRTSSISSSPPAWSRTRPTSCATGTTFWIVKPRIGVGGVSGLGTLLSGAYIGLAPGEGEAARTFTGLEEPPPISANVPGREFVLTAAEPGLGQPRRADLLPRHRYRPGARLQAQRRRARPRHHDLRQGAVPRPGPHHQPVLECQRHQPSPRAPPASRSRLRSLQALLIGGIKVDTPLGAEKVEVAAEGARFPLYRERARIGAGAVHREDPVPGLLRRFRARLEHRCPGRVPRHHGGYGHQRQPQVRPRKPTRSGSRSPSTSSRNGSSRTSPRRSCSDRTTAGWPTLVERGCARSCRPAIC